MRFSTISPCCEDEWTLVVAELDAGVEIDGSAWSSPVQQRRGPLAILQRLLTAQAHVRWRGPIATTPAPLLARPQSSSIVRS
jgi:hypothetical protein